jgi:homoaconitase/3-isopropylmalate dehydratase large subunit
MQRLMAICCAAISACASSGILTVDRDTYMVAKRSAQVGFGPAVAAAAYVYDQANSFCAKKYASVETIKLDQVDSGFARPASASLTFRCAPK